jgi:hypothetical protein
MRRKKAIKRGRWASVFVAAVVGYLLGSWNAAAVHSSQAANAPTAAQTVAMRFPSDFQETPLQASAAQAPAPSYQLASESTVVLHDANRALFVPEPMIPAQQIPAQQLPVQQQPAQPETAQATGPDQTQQAVADQAPVRVADLSAEPPVAPTRALAAPILPKPRDLASTPKPHPVPVHHQASRPANIFDDAQLAIIRRRLHLTPDQEEMWPAVAAALRNIGIQHEREERARGASGEIDPDSPQVQDLKSAAIPLIMSFSDEQKDEVRTLARGMGLNQLASQF